MVTKVEIETHAYGRIYLGTVSTKKTRKAIYPVPRRYARWYPGLTDYRVS